MEVEQITLLQIYLRRWRPSTYQLDPVQELILSDWTLANIRKEVRMCTPALNYLFCTCLYTYVCVCVCVCMYMCQQFV